LGFFNILHKDKNTSARSGLITTSRGVIKTPVFMPVGTKATVKAITQQQLYDMGCEIILGNLYHLYLAPGIDIIKKAGGLHDFMSWNKNILTDSGGFQVFSLDKIRKITDEGVEFKSIIDGSMHFFTPGNVIRMQADLGSDIIMVLDECIPFTDDLSYTKKAAERTLDWAVISIRERDRLNDIRQNTSNEHERDTAAGRPGQEIPAGNTAGLNKLHVFGIIQGGFIKQTRKLCAESISSMDFDGIAVGGLSVGENREITMDMLGYTSEFTDRSKPFYFMGLGDPLGIIDAINYGVDMFDCVMPTRISRMGSAFTSTGKINIKNKKFSDDFTPLDLNCGCYTCKNFSKAYLKHIYKSKEILSAILLTIHNLTFIFDLVQDSRTAISKDRFEQFRQSFKSKYLMNKI
jgi:tRNA-guanine transglycosylases, various specificities/tRNA-guanine transglycosylases, various specificities